MTIQYFSKFPDDPKPADGKIVRIDFDFSGNRDDSPALIWFWREVDVRYGITAISSHRATTMRRAAALLISLMVGGMKSEIRQLTEAKSLILWKK